MRAEAGISPWYQVALGPDMERVEGFAAFGVGEGREQHKGNSIKGTDKGNSIKQRYCIRFLLLL